MLNYERLSDPVLPTGPFLARLGRNLALASALIAVSLLIGMVGYHGFEHMTWIDAFANASMILSGMGPIGPLQTSGGKIFAGFYALYSGLLLIAIAGVILAPLFHRLLHRLHAQDDGDPTDETEKEPGQGAS